MSTRIRIWAFHPDYGRFVGRDAVTQLSNAGTVLEKVGKMPDGPFKTKMHRLRAIGETSDWKVRLFRVPRKVDLSRTKWGAFLASQGMFPRKLRGGKAPQRELIVPQPQVGARGDVVGNPEQAIPLVWQVRRNLLLEQVAAGPVLQQANMQAGQQVQAAIANGERIRWMPDQLMNIEWVGRPPQIRPQIHQVNEENDAGEILRVVHGRLPLEEQEP